MTFARRKAEKIEKQMGTEARYTQRLILRQHNLSVDIKIVNIAFVATASSILYSKNKRRHHDHLRKSRINQDNTGVNELFILLLC